MKVARPLFSPATREWG